ncbi:MAG: polysaccharide biosynthesis tyrosine autokinase [Deltaproteobacteria bacterium]|nr:polysaccharide biosynthesis tyrosine autokinase [Deltaproteobacteria bacterium]
MELKIIWEIICRRKWIIIQAFLIISLTAIIGSFLLPSVYETSAKVYAKTSNTASSLLATIGLQGVDQQEVETETRLELAIVGPILEEVISKLQLRARDGSLLKPSELKKSKFIVSSIFPQAYVELEQIEDADLIEIKAQSPDAEEAAIIANSLAEVYIEHNLSQMKEEYRNAKGFIENQIKLTRADYFNLLNEIKQFMIAEDTVDLETETRVAIETMVDLIKGKEDNILNISRVRAEIETLKGQLDRENDAKVSSSAITENPQIKNLKTTLTDLELELAGMLMEKRPAHPDVAAINEKIARIRDELKTEISVFQETSTSLQDFERELAALKAQRKNIDTNIKSHISLLRVMPHKVFRESQLELKYNVSQEHYSSLLESLYQVGIAEAMAISEIRLVEAATVPDIDDPESPSIILNSIVGIFLGLMFGLGLGFMVDYLDDTIKTSDEVKNLGITLLGTIPKFRRGQPKLISEMDPKNPLPESYRTIRNSIKFATLDKPVTSLIVTSALEKEGKSTTAINLAISFAHEGKRVVVLDADLRKPAIHQFFGVSNLRGVANILAEETGLKESIIKTDIKGLSLLTSGPIPHDPGRLIESNKMKHLIGELTEQYDMVIIDSPPVLVANDAIILAGYVDGSIGILESEKLTLKAFYQLKDFLIQANVYLIGMILNKFKLGTDG